MTVESSQNKLIVVKIGSSLLTGAGGQLAVDKLEQHVEALVKVREAGHQVVLVSSGAVAAGFSELGYSSRPSTIEARQASASVGQGLLIHAYAEAFRKHEIVVGQLLLNPRDFALRESYNNALSSLSLVLERGALPIINENDTVAISKFAFGDNDMLAALVSALLHADLLAILTDIDGLYDGDPRANSDAKLIERVDEIDQKIMELASGSRTDVGTGGMEAKLRAAERALSLGVPVFIGDGRSPSSDKILEILMNKGRGTYFGNASSLRLKRKKQWIAFHSEVNGKITIDAGAADALTHRGKSLLPAGIVDSSGQFAVGDVIEVVGPTDDIIGRGVSQYSSEQVALVKGQSTDFARSELGIEKVEVIHRDDWVLLA